MSSEDTILTVSDSHINTVWAMSNEWNDMRGKKNTERNSELELNNITVQFYYWLSKNLFVKSILVK